MAYNPFGIFRRNQRAIFAVVTVVVMFMFVLSSGMSGKADFFNWLPDWVRSKSKADTVCTIDGHRVTHREIDQLRFQRVVGAKFTQMAGMQAVRSLRRELVEVVPKVSPERMFIFQAALNASTQEQFLQFASLASRIKDDPKAKDADKNAANILEAILNLTVMGGQISPIPMRTTRDMIDFMLWQKKAKQLGIQYSVEETINLVNREFLNHFKDDVEVRRLLREEYRDRYSDELLAKALADEFSVRAAFKAITGYAGRGDQTLSAPPIFTPAYELFDYYREKTSPTAYQALRIPVECFMHQVKETPSESELQRLFNERREYEPNPEKEEPGFKEPRKVKVEWISANGTEPYYRKQAVEFLTKGPIAVALIPPAVGVWSHLAVAPIGASDPLLRKEYEHKVNEHQLQLDTRWDRPTFSSLLGPLYAAMDTSVVRPANLAALAGGAAGSLAGKAHFLLPTNLLLGATVAAEQRGRIKAGLPLVLGTLPTPGMLPNFVAGSAAFRKNLPEPLPLEAFKPELLKDLTESKARELAINDLKKLKESIDKLTETGKAREAAAKDLLADYVKTRGVNRGASSDYEGEFTIGDDAGLAPLKAVLDKENNPHAFGGSAPRIQFGTRFFWSVNPRTGARETAVGNYKPEFYPERAAEMASFSTGKAEPVFLAWRTSEKQATRLLFAAARPKVLEAWKRIKARDLAKAEAERIANELRNKPGESEFIIVQNMADFEAQLKVKCNDPKGMERAKAFRLDNVAPLAIGISPDFTGRGPSQTVLPFQLKPTNEIPYPTPEMEKALLEERAKGVKTVFVQADRPKDSYYVFTILDRRERSPEEFKAHVFGLGMAFGGNGVGQQIIGAQRAEARTRNNESILALLKKEFKYVETEEQKKKLDDRKGGEE